MVDSILADSPWSGGCAVHRAGVVLVNLAVEDVLYTAWTRGSATHEPDAVSLPLHCGGAARGFVAAIAVLFLLITLFAPLLAPSDPYGRQDLSQCAVPLVDTALVRRGSVSHDTLTPSSTARALLCWRSSSPTGFALVLGSLAWSGHRMPWRRGGHADHAASMCCSRFRTCCWR